MTRPARHLALVELDDQGEITGRVDSEALQALETKAEKLANDLANAERDLRAKRRRIAELERDQIKERLEHPDRDFIKRVATSWHRVCRPEDFNGQRRINPISPDRFDAVAALAEMQKIEMVDGKRRKVWRYQAEDFKAAIAGAAFDPYVVTLKNGKPKAQNDLEQICRSVAKFESFIERCPYEVVPITPARLNPAELKRLASERASRNNPVLSSKARPTQPHASEVQHGWVVGSQVRGQAVLAAGRWPEERTVLQRLFREGAQTMPASWT